MPDQKTEKVLEFFQTEFDQDLKDFVDERNWEQEPGFVSRLFHNDLSKDDYTYLEESLQNLKHKRDSRSPKEYGLELVRNWLLEDIVAETISNEGLTAELTGEDSDREFLDSTTTDHDLEIQKGDKTIRIELAADFGGFWQKNNLADLRDNKYEKWKERENSVLLGLDFENQEFFILTPESTEAERTDHHPAWRKPAYRIDIEDVEFYKMDELEEVFPDFVKEDFLKVTH